MIKVVAITALIMTGCGRFDYTSSENPFSKSGTCYTDNFDNYNRSQPPPSDFGDLGVVDKEIYYPRAYVANIDGNDDGASVRVAYNALCNDSKIKKLMLQVVNFTDPTKTFIKDITPDFSGRKTFTLRYRDDACFYHNKKSLTTYAFALNEDGNSYYAGENRLSIAPRINDYIQTLSVKGGIKDFQINLKAEDHRYIKVKYIVGRGNYKDSSSFKVSFSGNERRNLRYLDYKRVFTTSSAYSFGAMVTRRLSACQIESELYTTSKYIDLNPTVDIYAVNKEYEKQTFKPDRHGNVRPPIILKTILSFKVDMSANYAQSIDFLRISVDGRIKDELRVSVSDTATRSFRYVYNGQEDNFRISAYVSNTEDKSDSDDASID